MNHDDAQRVIDLAAELDAAKVPFIGGEPTPHPDSSIWRSKYARRGPPVQLFSNLHRPRLRLRPEHCSLFERPRVVLRLVLQRRCHRAQHRTRRGVGHHGAPAAGDRRVKDT
ncbi:hypothetical protein ACFVXA_29545 [Streptomyces sp. NPDC058246]|uniref:hypothetical protein n=1 Tax=Streptomyces sp. NPDC058246 TaxID=3346400 RepID=UPI0036F11616